MRARVVAVAWWFAVAAALLLAPLAVRDRLPDPMATHWGTSGSVPDGASSLTGHLVTTELLWAGLWLVFFLLGLPRDKRAARTTSSACLWGMGVLLLGTTASTLAVNLDAATWREALLPGWHIPAVIAAAVAAGGLAAYLSRGAPDERSAVARPVLRLKPGQRAVWVSRVVNPWLAVASGAAALVTVVTGALALSGAAPAGFVAGLLPVLVILLLTGLATVAVSVRVGDDLIRIGFGPLGWPARRIPLSKIESAWSERRQPGEVGGWGFRGLPGSATIMLRGGECLVLRYRSGGRLTISIDDAERGASLINALLSERVTS
ncbi:SdpI family protein [Nonomuraea gerenzanensis]|uniref:DUF1648 domain-containing protein n=1 Tax=Nonomuraea gerenzanensis TaxID=93944 RepID=A0A1M4E6F4_9ACTN|nr:hypothetical protein [Nonomuraea gerenzanensis]UBU16731.1 hypothetical protein LCN96_17435 [Nonomuraea gerenzanensis]SBO94435.1 FIG01138286: hypothetical protein [Nonomuraea gerenzanensis]